MKRIIIGFCFLALVLLTGCSSSETMFYLNYNGAYAGSEQFLSTASLQTDSNSERYNEYIENDFIKTSDMPVSTFSTDVDTASYSNVRRYLNDGSLPPAMAVRIEEMINYFSYDLPAPIDGEPVRITMELGRAPWNQDHQLLMVGLKSMVIEYDETTPNNIVFLLDVSGSMGSPDKLPLLKQSMKLLVEELRPQDIISIVVYAGASGVVLEGGDSTDKREINNAIDHLSAGGSTAGGAGIELAYSIAQKYFIEGGNNRVILGSDGDFNVGISNVSDLEDFISEKKETGVFLSVLGFGTGNTKDDIMEALADHGNGVYYYIDCLKEAEKVLVHELGATMITVAKDVKLQVEFNPQNVKAYRLIGYENRVLNYEDFVDDTKDAGDMGSGHEVIAFYEIIPADSDEEIADLDYTIPEDLKYDGENYLDELMTLSIRYKDPTSDESELLQSVILVTDFTDTPSETFLFASAVVEFGLLLIDSEYQFNSDFNHVLSRAEDTLGIDEFGYRAEFIELVEIAQNLSD